MPIANTITSEVLFTDEVRKLLRYKSNESVCRLVRAGRLKPLSKSKPYRFSRVAIERFLQGD
jgi:hypothetical protein